MSHSLFLSDEEQPLSVLTSLLTMPLTLSSTPTVFQVTGCSNGQSWSPEDAGSEAMINAPFSQSLTSTRATLPV